MESYLVYLRIVIGARGIRINPLPCAYGCNTFRQIRNELMEATNIFAEVGTSDLSQVAIVTAERRIIMNAIIKPKIDEYRLIVKPTIPKLIQNCGDLITLIGTTKSAMKEASTMKSAFSIIDSVRLT